MATLMTIATVFGIGVAAALLMLTVILVADLVICGLRSIGRQFTFTDDSADGTAIL